LCHYATCCLLGVVVPPLCHYATCCSCVGEKGRWNASVLAQKAQVGKRVPLSCTSHRHSAAQVLGGRVPRSRSLSMYAHSRCESACCSASDSYMLYVLQQSCMPIFRARVRVRARTTVRWEVSASVCTCARAFAWWSVVHARHDQELQAPTSAALCGKLLSVLL
jgi:hypothetical protein